MSFDIGAKAVEERGEPRWVEYVSEGGMVRVRCLLKPRDPEIVRRLNAQYPVEERLTRAGRVTDPRTEDQRQAWVDGYIVGHLLDWDVTQDGQKAAISLETVSKLTDNIQSWVIRVTSADDLREFESPLAG